MFSDPKKNLEQFDLAPSMTVADFGSGAGYHSLLAAKSVGNSGRVYALDINQNLLLSLHREADKEHLSNIDCIWADVEADKGSKLADSVMDRIILTNILFQINNKESLASEVGRVTKSGGRVLIIDWTDSFGGLGPEQSKIFGKDKCRKLFEAKGFELFKEVDAGKHHYGLVLKKM